MLKLNKLTFLLCIRFYLKKYFLQLKFYTIDFEHQNVIRSDFNEIANLKIINQLKEKLKNHEFCIFTDYHDVTRGANFIEKFVSQIDRLKLVAIGLNSKHLKMIAAVLTKSGIKVCLHILFENT